MIYIKKIVVLSYILFLSQKAYFQNDNRFSMGNVYLIEHKICDTLVLKSGEIRLIKILSKKPESYFVKNCEKGNKFNIMLSSVERLIEGREVKKYINNWTDFHKKWYFDANLGLGFSFIKSDMPGGLRANISSGYQFMPKLGFGISLISGLYDDAYARFLFNSAVIDTRFILKRHIFMSHIGLVVPPNYNSYGDGLVDIKINYNRWNPTVGLSYRYRTRKCRTRGITILYSSYKEDFFPFNNANNNYSEISSMIDIRLILGITFPKHFVTKETD